MRKTILKTALLALATVGMLSIVSCEEKEGQEPTPSEKPYNPFIGTWVCTDELYSESGALQLIFGEDNTVVATNTTGELSAFDSLNTIYDFRANYLYFDGVNRGRYYFDFPSDSNLYVFNYIVDATGIVDGCSYNFERAGGVK